MQYLQCLQHPNSSSTVGMSAVMVVVYHPSSRAPNFGRRVLGRPSAVGLNVRFHSVHKETLKELLKK
jgi:hypothetical protein